MVLLKYNAGGEKKVGVQGTLLEVLKKAGENPEEVVVQRNGELIAEDEKIKKTDVLTVFKVVSKG